MRQPQMNRPALTRVWCAVKRRFLSKIGKIGQAIPGKYLEYVVNVRKSPICFTDMFGKKYWQYPGDHICANWQRRSVTDSCNVIRFIQNTVKPGWTCLDLGANIGAVSVPLWHQVGPTGQVISVEPDPRNIPRIQKNLALNNCSSEFVINTAITDTAQTMQLRCYPECNGWQTLGTTTAAFAHGYDFYTVDVRTMTFEQLMRQYQLTSCDLVKIDVEGAEILVLKGMRPFLQAHQIQYVIFEVNQATLEVLGGSVSQLMAFWDGLAYTLWKLDPQGVPHPLGNTDWNEDGVGDCVAVSNLLTRR